MKLIKLSALVAFLSILSLPAWSQDLRLRVAPELTIPLGDGDTFALGVGGSLTMDAEYLGFLAPYLGADVRSIGMTGLADGSSLLVASGGGGLGLFAFPLARLKVGAQAGSGIYVGSYKDSAGKETWTGNAFWRAGGELGFRFTPSLTVSALGSYVDLMNKEGGVPGSFYKGVAVSLVADIGLSTGKAEGRATLLSSEAAPLYPIVAPDYAKDAFGSVTLRNADSAEMRDVEVWFSIDGYTAAPALCAKIPYLGRGKTATVPLLASFSDQVMTVTENVSVRGEVIVSYKLLGEPRATKVETTVSILHRNALTWSDPRILASFVSPNDPAVLDSGKFLAGVVRSKARTELDSNLQYALGLFEGLRLTGVAYAPDPQTPYARLRAAPASVDYVQYPHQTLAYRGGDSDDIAALYAALLESVGVPAGLVPLDGEVLVAFKMSGGESATKGAFSDSGDFLFIDGEAWAPLRVSMLREGFLRAWSEGAAQVKAAPDAHRRFYRLTDAWRRFPPAGVPGITASTRKPSEDQVRAAFDNAVSLVVAKEVTPRAERMRLSFGPEGGSGRQRNSLGVLYARYGMYAEALAEFQAAAALGHQAASVNIGNVAFLIADYKTAAAWFERAAKERPEDVAAIIGLARSLYELDRYEEADALFRRATNYMPELAERYGYLSARVTGSAARASAVMDRGGGMLWGESD